MILVLLTILCWYLLGLLSMYLAFKLSILMKMELLGDALNREDWLVYSLSGFLMAVLLIVLVIIYLSRLVKGALPSKIKLWLKGDL